MRGPRIWIETYLTRTVAHTTNDYTLKASTGDLYAGGEEKDSAGAQVAAGQDLSFRLHVTDSHVVAPVVSGQTIYSTARVLYTETLLLEQAVGSGAIWIYAAGRNYCQTVSGHAGILTSASLYLYKTGTPDRWGLP